MIRPLLLFALWLFTMGAAWADVCPISKPLTVPDGGLDATKAAIAKKQLTVLAVGGAATIGQPAQGADFTYPARLEARLRAAFPDVAIKVAMLAIPRSSESIMVSKLSHELAAHKPNLILWGPGATAAARGIDPESFAANVSDAIEKVHVIGADMVLMTLQYAPSVARLMNLAPYRAAVLRLGDAGGIPVLDRYELMRSWNDSGFLDLDTTDPAMRVHIARTLYDCIAEAVTKGIVDAAR